MLLIGRFLDLMMLIGHFCMICVVIIADKLVIYNVCMLACTTSMMMIHYSQYICIQDIDSKMSGKDTWEYKIFHDNHIDLLYALSDHSGIATRLSRKLYKEKIISRAVRDATEIRGPHVTETMRVKAIIFAILAKIELNSKRYQEFRHILLTSNVGVDQAIVESLLPGMLIL